MANRTMQAKALKLQRQLRRLPRHMPEEVPGSFTEHSGTPIPARLKAEGVSTPRTPNRELIQGYKHRAQSLSRDEAADEAMIKKTWKTSFKGVTPKRLEVQAKIDATIASVREIVGEECPCFTIFHSHHHRARVFYNAQKTQWMLIHEDYVKGFVQRSMVYSDKVRLIDDFKSKKRRLVWVETRLLNHTEGG